MIGLRTKRLVWTVVFLGITLVAIVLECVAGLWHPAGWTIPWTEYIARYVPWPIQLLAYVALAVWLPFHFWRHDHMRGVAYRRGRQEVIEQVRAFAEERRADALAKDSAGVHRTDIDMIWPSEILELLRAVGGR